MKKLVHIKVSDKGWILEKLASEITSRLNYVSYGLDEDVNAEIQYYMTYGCRKERVSPIELALFTHKEDVPSAAEKFDFVASEVDYCIAQSLKTENIVKELGIEKVETISPGVDLDKYFPLVKIGVVGRTYHTGRKGEKLVEQVMDIPGIEWHFTGEGWPGPAKYIEEDNLPEFYRSLDYILVPALIEGGPMCVLEALASGCKVIASPVGWVPQFPHIEFKLGDAQDLRRVLLNVVEEKAVLRRSVESYTWQAWADKHHLLFSRLLARDPNADLKANNTITEAAKPPSISPENLRVLVAVHGAEMSSSLGGPSVRAPRTVEALRKLDVRADFVSGRNFSVENIDLVHALNVWHPDECEALLRQIEINDKPSIFSPIFLDLSELNFYNVRVRQLLLESESVNELYEKLELLCRENFEHRKLPLKDKEPFENYYPTIRRLASYPKHLILLSEHEKQLLEQIDVVHPSISIVKNPVNADLFDNGDPTLFRNLIGVKDYVLCVGRIETRKNQALLALALRDLNIPLVLIGHEADETYAELIRKWGGSNVIFAGRIEANSEMLASAYSGAKVFCLPSWSEGAPLVALEAAAAGCNMVLSDRSSEFEYFGDMARYVNPADINDIRKKVFDAWNDSESKTLAISQQIKTRIRSENSWEKYAFDTKSAYETALTIHLRETAKPNKDSRKRIYVDLTTLAHHYSTPTGIARVESRLANEMHKVFGDKVGYVVWNSYYAKFVKVSFTDFSLGDIRLFAGKGVPNFCNGLINSNLDFQTGDILLIFGGAWIRNTSYLRDLKALKIRYSIALISTVYDVIQHKMKFLFPDGVGEQFSENCKSIISISDMVMTCSEQSRTDIIDFSLETQTPVCPISVFRLGDEAVHLESESNHEMYREGLLELATDDKFVMFVSTIDVRKNHSLLLMLWKGLISEFGDAVPKLVLVGGVGWRGEEAINILNNSPALKDKVLLLHGIEDSSLDWLYRNCLFTVFPSRYEGWGLPVAESCRYGKFCLASNAGSLPEVAPGCAEYLDPLDFIAWYNALKKYCFEPDLLSAKTKLALNYQSTNWDHTAQHVISAIECVSASIRLPSLPLNKLLDFASQNQESACSGIRYLVQGWCTPELSGVWSSGHEAILGFQYDQATSDDLNLYVDTFGYTPDGDKVRVNVFINDVLVTEWNVSDISEIYAIKIPKTLLSTSRCLVVRFQIENPRSPSDIGLSDTRNLGLHLLNIRLSLGSAEAVIKPISVGIAKRVGNKIRRVKRSIMN